MTAEEWLTVGVVYLLLSALVAWFADARGHDPVNWFGISLLISPLFAFIAAVLVGRRPSN